MVMGPSGIVTGGKGGRSRTVTKGNPGVVSYKTVALDGTGDYTTIQSAINALPSTGGAIYLKNGTYTINSKITISKNDVSIIGSGWSTIFKAKDSLNDDMFSVTGDNCFLSNFQVDGNIANQTSGSGIVSSTNDRFQAFKLFVKDCFDFGIQIGSTVNYQWVSQCNIENCKTPLRITYCADSFFSDLRCIDAIQEVVLIDYSYRLKFINSVFSPYPNDVAYAVMKFIDFCYANQIVGCTFMSADRGGIRITGGSPNRFIISNNIFEYVCEATNNTYNSIQGDALTDSIITSNIFLETSAKTSKNAFEETGASNANIFYLNRIENSTSNVTIVGANSISGLNVTA